MKKILGGIAVVLFFAACNSNKGTSKTEANKTTAEKTIVGIWQMLAIRFHDGRVMAGEFMGNPYYQFSEEGKRTKTLRTVPAPPPEIVEYKIKGDSIFYPNTKYPPMKLAKISKDTLVFSNDKLSWHLARSAE